MTSSFAGDFFSVRNGPTTRIAGPYVHIVVPAHERPRIAAALRALMDERAQRIVLTEDLVPEQLRPRTLLVV